MKKTALTTASLIPTTRAWLPKSFKVFKPVEIAFKDEESILLLIAWYKSLPFSFKPLFVASKTKFFKPAGILDSSDALLEIKWQIHAIVP